jgi:EF-P beta-lysylation protein EpmB
MPAAPPPLWQREWQASFRNPQDLLEFLELDARETPHTLNLHPRFPFRVPRSYAARMRKGDWEDPLLQQVLPLETEEDERPGFVRDAVGDGAAQAGPGLLQKYHGRALLVLTGVCAVHCRYCFRREFPYAELPATRAEWERTYSLLSTDPDVTEILFSGGDPLSLSDANLRWHWERALALPHLKRIRIHTRLPVVLPARVDTHFLELVKEMAAQKPLLMVLHVNHAREIDAELTDRLGALRAAGALLLNQAVLLRGVNDTADAQVQLSEGLLEARVLPYYLHQLDRVRGAGHFEVPEEKGLELLEELRKRLPGYGVPRYVREVAGEASKLEVASLRFRFDSLV